MWLGSATTDLPDPVKVYQGVGLKAALATPASCTRSAGKSSASPRRNIPGRSGRGIRTCTIFGKGCVWICCSCFGSASSSILACGKKKAVIPRTINPVAHRDSFRTKEQFMHEIADVNRDLAEQSKCFTGGTPSDGAKLLPSQIPQPTIKCQ